MKTIHLPCYGIAVSLNDDGGGGSISSKLHEPTHDEDGNRFPDQSGINKFNGYMDALESIILGHAVSGIDIQDPKYIEGIETAVQAIGNELS